MAAFIDVEHALDPIYARKLGVDVDNLLVSQPDYGEQALEIADDADPLRTPSTCWWSTRWRRWCRRAELDGEMGDSFVGLQARLMSQALRKLTGVVSQVEHLPDLHQPDPREDRRHVRQSRRPPPAAAR